MKKTLQKAQQQTTKQNIRNRASLSSLRPLLLAWTLAAVFGCDDSSRTTMDVPDAASPSGLLPQAFRTIQMALADPDPRVRANAVEVVAATKQIGLMPKVHRLLADQFTPVRFLAVLAVGDLQYALAQKDLQQLLKDKDQNVRIAVAYALTKLGHSQYAKVFGDAITSKDQTVRANAALLLGKTGDQNALKYLYWVLQQKDSDDKVILQAAESIAMLGDQRIYPKLWTRLISAYADDRVIGVRAMGALATAQARDALVTMLDDAVLEVRLVAAGQLGRLNDPVGQPQVLEVFTKNLTAGLDGGGLERVRVLTALAIGEIGTENLAKFLPQLLKDESKFVRIAAAKAVLQCAMKK